MSLLPEKTLTFSPQLAATLGLEEAILLQTLIEIGFHQQARAESSDKWLTIDSRYLESLLPFWQLQDIQGFASNLQQQGVIQLDNQALKSAGKFRVCLENTHTSPPAIQIPATQETRQPAGSRQISPAWQPEPDVINQLSQYGIPQHFIHEQLPEFITYWSERGEPHYSWGSKFLKHTLRLWREQQNKDARQLREATMHSDWRPSTDAVDILHRQAGINRNFIEDAIPEFILYWKEKGNRSSTWNSQFVQHVRRQWLKFNASLEHDAEPHIIPPDWKPAEDLYEVLKLANIPKEFAVQEIPAFILYWRETGRAENSWNTKFLQYIKKRWSYSLANTKQVTTDNGKRQGTDQPVSTRNRSIIEDLTDRSWAN